MLEFMVNTKKDDLITQSLDLNFSLICGLDLKGSAAAADCMDLCSLMHVKNELILFLHLVPDAI